MNVTLETALLAIGLLVLVRAFIQKALDLAIIGVVLVLLGMTGIFDGVLTWVDQTLIQKPDTMTYFEYFRSFFV